MRFKRTRVKIASYLKTQADKPRASKKVRKTIYQVLPKIYPLEKKLPEGQVFIPARQLSREAQDTISRIQSSLFFPSADKATGIVVQLFGYMGLPGYFAYVTGRALAAQPFNLPHPVAADEFALASTMMITGAIGMYKLAVRTDQLIEDTAFLSKYFCKGLSGRANKLKERYNFFFVPRDKKGVVLTKIKPEIIKAVGQLHGDEMVVLSPSGDIVYNGIQRRFAEKPGQPNRRLGENEERFVSKKA